MSLGIRQPTHWEGVFRALDLKGDLPNELLPSSSLTYQLEDFAALHWSYSRRVTRFAQLERQAASAGNYSQLNFGARPTDSSRAMIVIHRIIIDNENPGPIGVYVGFLESAFAGGTAANTNLDDRQTPLIANGPLLSARATPAAAPLSYPAPRIYVPGQNSREFTEPIVMTFKQNPGAAVPQYLSFVTDVINVTLAVNVFYTYRQLLTSEG